MGAKLSSTLEMRTPNLRLNEEQITKLGTYAGQRFQSLRTDNSDRIKADKNSWKIYSRDRKDRAQPDTIFDRSNIAIPLAAMVVDSFVARADDAVTGTAPFFHFKPRGASDPSTAKDFDDYFRYKLDTKAKVRATMQDGYEPIFIQRAAFFKTIYHEEHDEWMDYEKRILWNIATDEPVRIVNPYGGGEWEFIVEHEHQFIDVVDELTGLARKQSIKYPFFYLNEELMEYRPHPKGLKVHSVRFKGPKVVQVDYDAILIPSTAESVEDADIIEQFDKPIEWAEKMWVSRKGKTFEEFKAGLRKPDSSKKTELERNESDKEGLSFDEEVTSVRVLECWFKRDILKKGSPQRFVVWVDAETFTPISWEYRSIVVPSGNTPYKAISIARRPNRWWGRSLVEMLEDLQEFVDKQYNSQAYRNELSANPFVGQDDTALEDDEEDDVEQVPGQVYKVKAGKSISDVFSFATLPQADNKTQALIDFVIEIVQLWLGVSDLSQGDSDQISKHNTATGIEATLREGSKLSRKWIRRIVKGYKSILDDLVKLTLDTLDPVEVFEVTERESLGLKRMSSDELRKYDIDVEVVISQNEGGRKIENARAALEAQQFYFNALMANPDMARFNRPLIVSILEELGFPDADQLVPAFDDEQGAEEVLRLQQQHQQHLMLLAQTGASGVSDPTKELLPTR